MTQTSEVNPNDPKHGDGSGTLMYDQPNLARDLEIARLELEVCQAAIAYVNGVGYDGNSIQAETDAIQRFIDLYNTLMVSTKSLINARKEIEAAFLYQTVPSGLPPPVIKP